ncbi:MAG TPA: hypothetical protein VLX11_15685 [Candidatus Acidoferrales bacterium]|nr:hypothetical protein [Candidatus Acidoferrales bacterium]
MQTFAEILRNSEPIFRRAVILVLLYLIPSFQAMQPIGDPDIWWRLRTGEWIVENHAVPTTDFLSTKAMDKPWIEYSWPFSVLVYVVYAGFGLAGLVYFVVAMALLISLTIHRLVRKARLPFYAEIGLVALVLVSLRPLMTPRPWLFTILFFSIELMIIARVRNSQDSRRLWLLPFLFFLWANIHIQFLYGLAALFLYLAELILLNYGHLIGYKKPAPNVRIKEVIFVILCCIGATFATPYHTVLYQQIFEYIGLNQAFQSITELLPMFFRSPDNWIVLFLTLAAVYILGWQRTWLPYPTSLILIAIFVAFRARRDVWFLSIISAWVISECLHSSWKASDARLSVKPILLSAAGIVLALYFMSIHYQLNEKHLRSEVAAKYPVDAVNYVKSRRLSGPLFNDYDWGGFLIWSLPELPVSIDGRLNLFGDEGLTRSIQTWEGRPGWSSDPDLLKANLIIAQKNSALASLLRLHPDYKVVYEDNVAVVIVRIRRS